ncbi:MAG TPA: RNA polymerase sigma-70 factor [Chitinophagaceae bacterium]|jgi:RNA polymerase sigma-70 factor (ECF subfamily)
MSTSLNKELLPQNDLWERLLKDDKEAFVVLYRSYWALLYRSAFNFLQNREQSMDVVQDVFTWLWEHRRQLHIKTSLKGYLLAAVKFKTANVVRDSKIHNNAYSRIADVQSLPDSTGTGFQLEVKELEDLIRQTVHALPDKCRTVYELSRHENLSNREIAHALGISIKTVESQITIALRRLRGAVARLFIF